MDHDKDWNRIVNIDEEYSVSELRQLNKDSSHSNAHGYASPLQSDDWNRSGHNKFVDKQQHISRWNVFIGIDLDCERNSSDISKA